MTKTVPHTLEPKGSPNQVFDAAYVALAVALFAAMSLGRRVDLTGDVAVVTWDPATWHFVHDAAKAFLMPILLVRTCVGTGGCRVKGLSTHGVGFWVAWAMMLCWVGDVALTRDGSLAFLIGLSAFLLGHFGYIMAFRRIVQAVNLGVTSLRSRVVVASLLGSVVLGLNILLLEGAGDMAPALLVYSLVIGTMAFTAWSMDAGSGGVEFRKAVRLLSLGALVFMASDILIAIDKFYEPFSWSHHAVMLTYIIAQWMIAQGIYLLMKRD
jgi:uncharacterized membrane protein YhhN